MSMTSTDRKAPGTPHSNAHLLAFFTFLHRIIQEAGLHQLPEGQRSPMADRGVADLLKTIPMAPMRLSGMATLKADSQRHGALTIERNGRTRWMVWVRRHDDNGEFHNYGHEGYVLSTSAPGRGIWLAAAEEALAALQTIKLVLTDPEVIIRGSAGV